MDGEPRTDANDVGTEPAPMPLQGKPNPRHAAIRSALEQRRGHDAGTSAIAEAAMALSREVTDRLTPMIGSRGVDAIISRSLQLTTPAFPWLGLAGEHLDGVGSLASFKARLEVRDPMAATEASVALLVAFTDMLVTMIGASLTDRLLDPIWAPPAPASAKENAS
jgi:hypothetical protein